MNLNEYEYITFILNILTKLSKNIKLTNENRYIHIYSIHIMRKLYVNLKLNSLYN